MRAYLNLDKENIVFVVKNRVNKSIVVTKNKEMISEEEASKLLKHIKDNYIDELYIHIDISIRSRISIRRVLNNNNIKYESYRMEKNKEVII